MIDLEGKLTELSTVVSERHRDSTVRKVKKHKGVIQHVCCLSNKRSRNTDKEKVKGTNNQIYN